MNNEEIESRLQSLEINTQAILDRLNRIEGQLNPTQSIADNPAPPSAHTSVSVVTPPPIISEPIVAHEREHIKPKIPDYMRQNMSPEPSSDTNPQPATAASKPANADDLEYKFGINGLLRGGAAVIVIAFLFFVAIMISKGAITPPVQFVGEIGACLAFVGIGLWKRNEREDFGQLMVGIGSFGLYASFAGGYAYKHLYEGEPLVAMYMGLSLVNLAYSYWRSSKSFLTIGMIGGLVAAMMPMHKDKVMLDFILHFLILVPCSAIIIRNKWNGMAGLMWAVSTSALIPATTSHFDQAFRVGATYLNCAVALYACGRTFKQSKFDEHAAIQAAMLILTGFFAIAIDSGHKGSLHALALTGIAVAIGYAVQENVKARNSTWLGGLIVFAIMTPMGYTQSIAAYWYGVEALALILFALQFQLVALWAVSLTTFLFSTIAYLFNPDKELITFARFSPPLELLLLAILSSTIVLHVRFALQKGTKDAQDIALFTVGSLLVAFFVRALNILLGHGNTPLQVEDVNELGIGLASLIATLFAVTNRRIGLIVVSALLSTAAGVLAIVIDPVWTPHWMSPVVIFLAGSSVLLSCTYLFQSDEGSNRETVVAFGGIAMSAFFVRLMHLAGINHLLDLTKETSTYFSFGLLNIIWLGFALRNRRLAYLVCAWLAFILSAASGASLPSDTLPRWLPPTLLAIPLISLSVLYAITPRKSGEEAMATTLMVVPGWFLATLFLRHELRQPWIGLNPIASFTVSWVIFAVFLIVVGFKFDRRYLRYWALAVFGITVGKVFIVDLSELDSVIRVAMLTLLGLGMMGGGYWYILWRRAHGPKPTASVTDEPNP